MTGGELKELREKSGYSYKEFAALIGISPACLGFYISGRTPISTKREAQIHTVLGGVD